MAVVVAAAEGSEEGQQEEEIFSVVQHRRVPLPVLPADSIEGIEAAAAAAAGRDVVLDAVVVVSVRITNTVTTIPWRGGLS
jgi:hypothetical protein